MLFTYIYAILWSLYASTVWVSSIRWTASYSSFISYIELDCIIIGSRWPGLKISYHSFWNVWKEKRSPGQGNQFIGFLVKVTVSVLRGHKSTFWLFLIEENDIFQMLFVPWKILFLAEVMAGQRSTPMWNYIACVIFNRVPWKTTFKIYLLLHFLSNHPETFRICSKDYLETSLPMILRPLNWNYWL